MSAIKSAVRTKIFKDDRLDIDQIDHYSLSFFIASSSVQVSVFDEKRRRLLLYEKYNAKSDSVLEVLDEVHRDHILISAGFWQTVRVVIDSRQFCIVPSNLFSFEHQFDYIKLNCKTDPNIDTYRSLTFDPLGIAYVFALEKAVVKWFSDKYFNLEVRHSHIGLHFVQQARKLTTKKDEHKIFINLGDSEMLLAGMNLGKLAIYNQFPITTEEQSVKHILIAAKQFSNLGQDIPIHLWGQKSRMDEFRPLLNRYFKNLTIGTRPKIKLGIPFNQLEAFEIMDVLSVYV